MHSAGTVAVDKESEENKRVIVCETHADTRCGDYWTGQYGYDMEKLMVSDYEKNDAYPDDDTVTTVYYIESLERGDIPWDTSDMSQIEALAEEENIKTYDLPTSRLRVTTESLA